MKNLALKKIQKIGFYNPPLDGRRNFQGDLLDFNERTIDTDPGILRAIRKFIDNGKLQIYPEYSGLNKKIADYVGVSEKNIMITNGVDQGIDLIFRTFTDKDEVVIPQPSFAMFFQAAKIAGNKIIRPLCDKDSMEFPLDQVLKTINKRTKLILICNPNNPTGNILSGKQIALIADYAKGAIIYVDEAYFEFSKISAVGLIKKFPNIIISRTFSKAFGLGGLRIGYLVACPQYIQEMLKVRGPYDINMPAYFGAVAALENMSSTRRYVAEVMGKAKSLVEKFFVDNNIKFFPSQSNFILFKPDNPQNVFKILKENGILVRMQKQIPAVNMLRVTIGTVSQMQKFITVYKNKILIQKYAFLDRDGTLIFEPQDTFQIDTLKQLKVLPGVAVGLRRLIKSGYKLIMITNQDGLGTKFFPKKNFETVQDGLMKTFKNKGITFERIFVCPHFAKDNCACRKPKTILVDNFLKEITIDKENSFVCGDRKSDRDFAKNIKINFLSMETNGNFIKSIKSKIYVTKKSRV